MRQKKKKWIQCSYWNDNKISYYGRLFFRFTWIIMTTPINYGWLFFRFTLKKNLKYAYSIYIWNSHPCQIKNVQSWDKKIYEIWQNRNWNINAFYCVEETFIIKHWLTIPPLATAISLIVFFLLSPNPGALTAHTWRPTFSLKTLNKNSEFL